MAAGQDVLIRLAGVGKRYPSLDGGGGVCARFGRS